jgi:hypothetical protein
MAYRSRLMAPCSPSEDVIGSYCQATAVLTQCYSSPTAILLDSYLVHGRVLLSPCTAKPRYFPQETQDKHEDERLRKIFRPGDGKKRFLAQD